MFQFWNFDPGWMNYSPWDDPMPYARAQATLADLPLMSSEYLIYVSG